MAISSISLISCFLDVLKRYFLNYSEEVPLAPVIAASLFYMFHMHCISLVRSLHCRTFSASFLITFLSPEIAPPINIHAGDRGSTVVKVTGSIPEGVIGIFD
jgi:hypothetical protein